MLGRLVLLWGSAAWASAAASAAMQPTAAQPTPASVAAGPAAAGLFERDWVLMNWALKFYDAYHDILLSPAEAEPAAAQFRKIADANGDGRVTPEEYRAARAFILARY
jgi:hypothetical protein